MTLRQLNDKVTLVKNHTLFYSQLYDYAGQQVILVGPDDHPGSKLLFAELVSDGVLELVAILPEGEVYRLLKPVIQFYCGFAAGYSLRYELHDWADGPWQLMPGHRCARLMGMSQSEAVAAYAELAMRCQVAIETINLSGLSPLIEVFF